LLDSGNPCSLSRLPIDVVQIERSATVPTQNGLLLLRFVALVLLGRQLALQVRDLLVDLGLLSLQLRKLLLVRGQDHPVKLALIQLQFRLGALEHVDH